MLGTAEQRDEFRRGGAFLAHRMGVIVRHSKLVRSTSELGQNARLEDEFTADDLFMDVEGHIKPGNDFVAVLNAQVEATDVVLAVIGPRWSKLLTVRANDLDDFLLIEIKAALEKDKRVIPVLVGGANMPRADSLPEAIRPRGALPLCAGKSG